jgi:prophage regulatory protein
MVVMRFHRRAAYDERGVLEGSFFLTHPYSDSLLRIAEVLKLIPVSRSAWYRGIRIGIYPSPIKIGRKVALWRTSTINALVTSLAEAK